MVHLTLKKLSTGRIAPRRGERWIDTPATTYRDRWKRVFDMTVAVAFLIIALPLIAVLMILAAADGGNPIFGHSRIGHGGRSFRCLKVRTMVVDADARLARLLAEDPVAAEEWERHRKLHRDPRITWIGRFLRRTSLDELPQLWNVLRGDMSIVGPRPITMDEIKLYGASARSYVRVRPGLTGPWQVSGRNSVTFAERVDFDRAYADHLTFAQDISIILRTVPAVLRGTGC